MRWHNSRQARDPTHAADRESVPPTFVEPRTPARLAPDRGIDRIERTNVTESLRLGARLRTVVLIPVYNDRDGLIRSLDSLQGDGGVFDVVVVDDGSTPPLDIPAALPFRTELLRLDGNRGIVGALNTGLQHIAATGHYEYVARLDAGDLSLPGRMAAQMAFLDAHPDHAVVGCWARHVDPNGRLLFDFHPPAAHQRVIRFLRYRSALVHTSIMLRLRALEELGFYGEPFAGAEDVELYLRLAHGYKLANLEQTLVVREVTPNSITSRRQSVALGRLRALVHHFDWRSIHAYLGLGSNLTLLLLPRSSVLRVRAWADRWRRRSSGGNATQS
jgi:glycosyltransferase involved in cell wall biosynthesis